MHIPTGMRDRSPPQPLATLTRAVAVPCAWNLAGRCSSSLAQQTTGSYAAPSSFAFPSPGNGAALDYPVVDISGQSAGSITLPGDVFNAPVRRDILHRVVRWQLAMRQQGTHKTKTRSEVRGGGRKPRPQKGSGRSRQGSIRAGQWRGGGVIHGPVPRSHAHKLPKRVRRLGLTSALSVRRAWWGGGVMCVCGGWGALASHQQAWWLIDR